MKVSVRMSVQPAGAVTVEVPRTLSEASITSPATVPVGRFRLMLVVDAVVRAGADRAQGGRRPGAHVGHRPGERSVASTVAPSRTVIDTAYGLEAAATELMVPVIRPLEVLIDKPGGRLVAA